MPEEDRPLRDCRGEVVAPGEFVELLAKSGQLLKGPIEYEGSRSGARLWSVDGQKFSTSQIEESSVRRLDWKRWRNAAKRADEFWNSHLMRGS